MIFLPPLRLPCIINKLSSLPDLSLMPGNALPDKGYGSARALPLLIASLVVSWCQACLLHVPFLYFRESTIQDGTLFLVKSRCAELFSNLLSFFHVGNSTIALDEMDGMISEVSLDYKYYKEFLVSPVAGENTE